MIFVACVCFLLVVSSVFFFFLLLHCVLVDPWFLTSTLEPGVDDLVGLQGGDHDEGDPEEDEDAGGDGLDAPGAAELAAHRRVAPQQQDEDGDQGLRAEQRHGEAQAANRKGITIN